MSCHNKAFTKQPYCDSASFTDRCCTAAGGIIFLSFGVSIFYYHYSLGGVE